MTMKAQSVFCYEDNQQEVNRFEMVKAESRHGQECYDDMCACISDATVRNWDRLNTDSANRLTARANKRRSKKRILPLEYMNNKDSVVFIHTMLDYIDARQLSIFSVIFSLGINLLKKSSLYGKRHVMNTLDEYSDISIEKELTYINMPGDEFDILGLVYQSYLQEGMKNVIGSYYTPHRIAYNMTKDYTFTNGEKFLDPCCGSGAFLITVSANNPYQIYGVDNDKIAVLISKINLLIRYSDYEFIPQVFCFDYLIGNFLTQSNPVFEREFDYIATNPPWGGTGKRFDSISEIASKENFSYFFVRAFEQLKKTGNIRFLFPESILNVKIHKDIRQFILNKAGLISITMHDRTFSGVTTEYVDIECGFGASNTQFTLINGKEKRLISLYTVRQTENMVFNLMSNDDLSIVQIVKEKGMFSLKNSVWALGIVTGDNKAKLFSMCDEGMEKIYTGKEIQPYFLRPAMKYIYYNRENFQQVAKEEIYRAPEKLVYKFISNKLVFAYDDNGSLFLNSANILIPRIPSMGIKAVLAFLNSELFQFMYIKLFGEVKVLKGNLNELPFPQIREDDNVILTRLVEDVLNGSDVAREKINEYIFSFYGLSDQQIQHVRRVANGKIDS